MRREMFAVLLAGLLVLPGCIGSDVGIDLYGVEYREPPDAPDFTLFDQNGESFTLSEHEGKVVVVAFVYTSCPDICLIISANLDYIDQNLADYSDDIVIVSVTIDPARDTVSHLAEWTEQMGYDWYHLTGPTATLQDTYRSWNVIVDNEHINASQPPEDGTNRIAVLFPDNSTFHQDEVAAGMSAVDFATQTFNSSNISYNISEGVIADWQSGDEWSWVLYLWDIDNESWVPYEQDISSISMDEMSCSYLSLIHI